MKPSFALTLSNDRVGLLHRTPKGWMPVGDCAFGSPDFDAALEYLRSSALGLSPKGITTKLVIPNSEILYLEIEAPGSDANTRRRQIRTALKDKTPYPVEELIFDSWGKGPMVQVAVVWKGTLDEAEAFADEHRFNPVSFVAIPDEGRFKGEPWFGMTKVAGTILSAGEKVERDQDPILLAARELGKVEPVEPAAAAAPVAAPVVAPPAAPAAAAPEPAPAEPPAPEPVPATPAETPAEEPAPAPVELPATPAEAPAPLPAEAPLPEPELPDEAPVELPESPPFLEVSARPIPEFHVRRPVTAAPAPAVPPPAAAASLDPVVDEAPMAVDVPGDPAPAKPAARSGQAAVDDVPPMPAGLGGRRATTSARPAVAEAAPRRAVEAPVPSGLAARRPAVAEDEDLPPEPSPAALAAFASRRAPETTPRPVTPPARGVLSDGPNSFRPPVERPAPARPATARAAGDIPQPVGARPAPRSDATVKGLGGPVTSPTIPGAGKPRKVDIPPPAEGTPPPPRPAKASKNSLGSRPAPVRGKPKYLGLILTGALLLLIILVGAWSKLVFSQNDTADQPVVASDAGTAAQDAAPLTDAELAAMNEAEAEADGQVLDTSAATADAPPAETLPADALPAETAAGAEPATPPATDTAAAETTPPAAADSAAQTPTEAAAPAAEPAPATPIGEAADAAPTPATEPQDEIFLASTDQPPTTPDPVALPGPAALADAAPGFQMPPPAFGTVYQFDANGFLIPTKDGILTPDGVMLIAGRPPKLPPDRPAAVTEAAAAAAAARAAEAAAATAAATPGAIAAGVAAAPGPDPFAADPGLAEFKPKARPDTLKPAAAAGDDASLAPAADSRFASLRPRARTESAIAAAVAANVSTAADASLVTASASPLAVQVSMKPAPRPKDMSRAVEAAVAAAVSQPVPEAAPEPAAQPQLASAEPPPVKPAKPAKPAKAQPDPDLGADSEPEIDNSRDRSPVIKGVVAKNATFVNALNLSKTSLIGVYGTPSKRYALVRLSTGRYKKVKVGDSVDGGQVAAISQSELTYRKGGRSYTLSMPKG